MTTLEMMNEAAKTGKTYVVHGGFFKYSLTKGFYSEYLELCKDGNNYTIAYLNEILRFDNWSLCPPTKMKIYQIHEYGGEWEASFDRIVKSVLKKEKAEEWKKWFEDAFERTLESSRLCYNCPLGMDDKITSEKLIEYCPRISEIDLEIADDGEIIDCDNYEFVYEENTQYRIEEVEVEE